MMSNNHVKLLLTVALTTFGAFCYYLFSGLFIYTICFWLSVSLLAI